MSPHAPLWEVFSHSLSSSPAPPSSLRSARDTKLRPLRLCWSLGSQDAPKGAVLRPALGGPPLCYGPGPWPVLGLAVSFHRALLFPISRRTCSTLCSHCSRCSLKYIFMAASTPVSHNPNTSGISGPVSISFLTHSELFLVLGGASDCLLELDIWVPRRTLGLLALLCWEGGAAVLPQVGDKSRFLRV